MAQQTGGFAILNTNDLGSGLGRIVDDTRGYYLIGFETLIPTGEAWDPNDVRVRVKRPGLKVRARRGLFGPADSRLPRESRHPGSAGRGGPLAVPVRRHRRAAHHAVRARRQGRLLRPLAVLRRSRRPDVRRRSGRHPPRRPDAAAPRHRRQRPLRRSGTDARPAPPRCGGVSAAAAARPALQRAPADRGRRAATRSAPPSWTLDPRRSARARSSSRCRRSARARSRCRAS